MPGSAVSPPKGTFQLKLDSFFHRGQTKSEQTSREKRLVKEILKENCKKDVNLSTNKDGATTCAKAIQKNVSKFAKPTSSTDDGTTDKARGTGVTVEARLRMAYTPKEPVLACLLSRDELRELCRSRNIDCEDLDVVSAKRRKISDGTAEIVKSPSTNRSQEYEVEKVVKVRLRTSKLECLIKWKGWHEKHNQWEPLHNLHCHQMLVDYLVNNQYQDAILAGVLRHVMEATLLDNPVLDLKIAYPLLSREFVLSEASQYTQKSLKVMRGEILNLQPSQLLARINEKFKGPSEFIRIMLERQEYLDELERWRQSIKETVQEPAALFVENFVDNEPPPTDFRFVSDYVYAEGIEIERAELGCSCRDCHTDKCGGLHNEGKKAYNEKGILSVAWRRGNSGIVECNASCTCPPSCFNRVTQHGRQVPVTIFKTDNGRGWGLRANAPIRAWSFVMEYLGEVITSEMASRRMDDMYLFDIDFNTDREAKYTVDALRCGNSSHFINHSCDPNLIVIPVWVNNLDLMMPRLAFFAIRDIRKHEELTFDYRVNVTETETLDMSRTSMDDSPTSGRLLFECRCGAQNCRGQFNPDN